MSDKKTKNETTSLEAQIERVLTFMAGAEIGSEDYTKAANQLDQLYKMRGLKKPPRFASADAWVGAGASLLGIIVIVAYEHGHTITSKAVGFVKKP